MQWAVSYYDFSIDDFKSRYNLLDEDVQYRVVPGQFDVHGATTVYVTVDDKIELPDDPPIFKDPPIDPKTAEDYAEEIAAILTASNPSVKDEVKDKLLRMIGARPPEAKAK